MLRGETILLGTARTDGERPIGSASRSARWRGARAAAGCPAGSRDAASRRRRTHEVAGGRLCPATPQYRYRERGEPNAPHGKRSPPALRVAHEAPGDRRPPRIDYRGVMWTSESWTLRSLHRPGLCGKKPRAKIHCRPSRGVSTHSAGQRHRTHVPLPAAGHPPAESRDEAQL